jgi:hypothetical protein
MPARIKVDPAKMTQQVRLLYETSIVKNLSPAKLAPILHVSMQQIYRWYAGDTPKRGSEQLIKIGLEAVRQLPDFLEPGKASWGSLWTDEEDPAEKKREADERKFHAQMTRLFDELQRKVTPGEKAVLFQNPNVWPDFVEVFSLIKKHNVKLPK